MNGAEPPGPAGEGGFLLTKVHHVSRRLLGRRLRAHGLEEFNPGQGRILFALWQGDGISGTELAERTALEKSTLTRMLDRLERDGLVRRDPAPDDRRSFRVVLTPRTRDMLTAFSQVSEEMRAVFYRGFTPAEIKIFEAALARILSNLESAIRP